MALEQLVNGMTGQQLANTIKNNFDKVLDVESAENKAENAGKALKTDYDATRYVEMELADGTPIRMRWDVFCQAIASVVAEQMNNVEYEVSSDDAVVIAQEVVSKVTSLMFNVIANGSTRSLVSGYVYPNKLYGLITVSKYDGSVTIVTLNNGSFTKS